MFQRKMFVAAYSADLGFLGKPAPLSYMAQCPASGALLDKGEGRESLRADRPAEHENRRLEDASHGLAILIEEGKSDRAMAGICREVSLKPTWI
jgi:hypothetical protein